MSPEAKLVLFLPLLLLVPFLAVMVAVPTTFNFVLNLRAVPREEGRAVVYRVKPFARIYLVVMALMNFALIWVEVRVHSFSHWIEVGITAIFATLLLLTSMLPWKVTLDDEGISCYRFIRGDRTIVWADLDHVEKRALRKNSDDTLWFFRSRRGKVIVLNETVFDCEEIVSRIRERQPCPEEPYRRRARTGQLDKPANPNK